MPISKQAAVRQMSVYLCNLANQVPLSTPATKIAAMNKISQLATALNQSGDLARAIREVYPEKSASEHMKLAMKLIRGLSEKRAMLLKRALMNAGQGVSKHPSASLTSGAMSQSSNIKLAADPNWASGVSPRAQNYASYMNQPTAAPAPAPVDRFAGRPSTPPRETQAVEPDQVAEPDQPPPRPASGRRIAENVEPNRIPPLEPDEPGLVPSTPVRPGTAPASVAHSLRDLPVEAENKYRQNFRAGRTQMTPDQAVAYWNQHYQNDPAHQQQMAKAWHASMPTSAENSAARANVGSQAASAGRNMLGGLNQAVGGLGGALGGSLRRMGQAGGPSAGPAVAARPAPQGDFGAANMGYAPGEYQGGTRAESLSSGPHALAMAAPGGLNAPSRPAVAAQSAPGRQPSNTRDLGLSGKAGPQPAFAGQAPAGLAKGGSVALAHAVATMIKQAADPFAG